MFERRTQLGLLSSFFNKKLIKNSKLNLFGKAISKIDLIQIGKQQIGTLTEIDLSHNSIQQLGEIKQFKEVQILNLSNNKIADQKQIQKLYKLGHLHTLFIKNNSINKKLLSTNQLRFLVSLNTDLTLVNEQTQQKIAFLVKQTDLLNKLSQFYYKLKLHTQLFLQKKINYDANFNPCNLLPKLKRFFEHLSFSDLTLRRYLITQIDANLFENQKELLFYLESKVKTVKKGLNQVLLSINGQIQQMKHFQYKNIQVSKTTKNENIRQNVFREKKFLPKDNIQQKYQSFSKLSRSKSKSLQKSQTRKERSSFEIQAQSSLFKNFQIQNQFTNTLGKIHPSFQLLHSPLSSLKSHEKDLLIQQLQIILKDSLKLNLKLKTVQQQNLQLREQIKDLKKHLTAITNQVNQYEKNQLQKLNDLERHYNEQLTRAEELEKENQKLSSQNEEQLERLQLLLEQNKIQTHQNAVLNKDIRNSQLICALREKLLKKKYLADLAHKSYHLNKLKNLKAYNQKRKQTYLKQSVVYELKMNVYLNYFEKQLQTKMKLKYLKSLLFRLDSGFSQSKKYQILLESFNKTKKRLFLCRLILRVKNKKQYYMKTEVVCKRRMKTKKILFLHKLKGNLSLLNSQKLDNYIAQCRQKLLNKKFFRLWKNLVSSFQQNSNNCQKQYVLKVKRTGLKQFIKTMLYQNNLRAKTSALVNFLFNFRKIRAYLFFTKTLSTRLLQREINANKIKVKKKHIYFIHFISQIKDRLIKKTFEQQDQDRRKTMIQQRENHQIKVNEKRKKLKFKLKNLILKFSLKMRQKMFQRQISTKKLENRISLGFKNEFILKIRSKFILNLQTMKKVAQLDKYKLRRSQIHIFFAQLVIVYNKRKVKIRELKQLKMKTFYSWKILFKQHILIIYREKYEQIQAYVENLTEKLIKTEDQNGILAQKLTEKEQLQKQYLNKCQELTYLLQTKQLKYENLKAIYQESLQNIEYYKQSKQQVSEQTRFCPNKETTNRFIKHIEKQLRKDKYNEEINFSNIDQKKYLLHEDRTIELKKKPSFIQDKAQIQNKNQRFSFISSFKRF